MFNGVGGFAFLSRGEAFLRGLGRKIEIYRDAPSLMMGIGELAGQRRDF